MRLLLIVGESTESFTFLEFYENPMLYFTVFLKMLLRISNLSAVSTRCNFWSIKLLEKSFGPIILLKKVYIKKRSKKTHGIVKRKRIRYIIFRN